MGATGGGEVGRSNVNGNVDDNVNGNVNGNINDNVIEISNGSGSGTINGIVSGSDNGNVSGGINRNAVRNGNVTISSNGDKLVAGSIPDSAARQSVLEAACEVNGDGKGPREEERLLQNVAAPTDTAAAVSVAATDGNSGVSVFNPPEVSVSGAEEGESTAKVAVAVAEKQVLPPASLAEVRVGGTLHGKRAWTDSGVGPS